MLGGGSEPELRTISLYGDVTEDSAKDIVAGLWYLKETAKTEELEDPEDLESNIKEVIRPAEILISTNGGNADDMFSIYDVMRLCREEMDWKALSCNDPLCYRRVSWAYAPVG